MPGANILARVLCRDQRFRQAHDIAQTEIKPLSGDRMQRLRRIADHDSPVSKHFRRRSKGKRIRAALTRLSNSPQPPAERGLQCMAELRVGPAQHLIALVERVTPNQRTSAMRHRQHRQRAIGSKTFKGASLMRDSGRDIRYHR